MTTPSIKRVGAFSPTSISGCGLWLDGNDPAGTGSQPANGATVSTWLDKSGNSNNGTSGSAAFQTDSLGGYINFTGSQTYSITNPNIVVNQYFTIFVVETLQNFSSANYGQYTFMAGTTSSANQNLHLRYGGTGLAGDADASTAKFGFFFNDLNGGSNISPFTTNAAQPTRVWAFSFTANSRIIYLFSMITGSDTNNSQITAWNGAVVGAMTAHGGQYYNGKMREILIYSGTITTTQRQQVEGYLAQKWGLKSNLPGNHPGITTTIYPSRRQVIIAPVPYYTQFSPTSVAGCQVWFDGADTSSMTFSSSNVTQWNDKSGKAFNATTPAGANSPTYLTATRELQFVDTNTNALRIAQGFGDALVGTTFSIFFVARRTTGSGYNYILGNPYEPKTSRTILMIGFFNNNMQTNTYSPEFNSSISTYSSPDPVRLYCFEVKSSSLATHILNGTQIGSDTQNYTLTSFTNPELGRRYGSIGHTFNLSEMIAFSPALTSTQRQQVESYLAQKWDLSSFLPSGHLNTTQPAGTPSFTQTVFKQIKRTIGVNNPTAPPVVSVRLINLNSASGGTTSGSFTVNSSVGGGTGTFTNSDVFLSSATWGMAQCFNGARSDYDLYMTQNPNFMEIVFPRALTVTKIFLVPRNQGDAFPSSLVLKADGTSVGTYTPTTVSQSLGMGISYTGTGFYIQPSISRTTWRFDFSSTPVSFGEIEFWGYST